MANNGRRPARDIILIGGSAGGIEALLKVVAAFPPDFAAKILVVVHTSAESPSVLPRVLERGSFLSAVHPRDGERLQPGHIYVAPPDHHLVLADGDILRVLRGPRENGHRPAIDPMFRSAAAHGYGTRAIAVVLSGFLDDGSAGLYAVRSRGGRAVVQEPGDAIASAMPENALQYAGADYILPARSIGEKLVELVGQSSKVVDMTQKKKPHKKGVAVRGNGKPSAEQVKAKSIGERRTEEEKEVAPNELIAYPDEGEGTPSPFACPECHGVLWEITEGGSVRYRCRVGHGYSEATLSEELSHSAESALWAAMRALDEKAAMTRRMADAATGPHRWAARLREQAETYAGHAEMLRRMILGEPVAAGETAEIDEAGRPA